MNLTYPIYLYWPSAQAFYEMTSARDLEASFGRNDVLEEDLSGWDSHGRRFKLHWDQVVGSAFPVLFDYDLEGLKQAARAYQKLRGDDDPYFFEEDIVDGECSPRAVQQFYSKILSCYQKAESH